MKIGFVKLFQFKQHAEIENGKSKVIILNNGDNKKQEKNMIS